MADKDKDAWVAKALGVPVDTIRKQTSDSAPLEQHRSRAFLINESKLPEAKKAQALQGLGLCQFDLEIVVHDHEGKEMTADFLSAMFEGIDVDPQSVTGKLERGYFVRKGLWAARSGNVTVDASFIDGGKYNKSHPSGSCHYTVEKGKLVLQADQGHEDTQTVKSSSESKKYEFGGGFDEEVGGEIEIKAAKIGGKGTSHSSHSEGTEFGEGETVSKTGKAPTNAFTVQQLK